MSSPESIGDLLDLALGGRLDSARELIATASGEGPGIPPVPAGLGDLLTTGAKHRVPDRPAKLRHHERIRE